MPEGALYVGRPTRYGNPFTVMNGGKQGWLVYDDRPRHDRGGYIASFATKPEALAHAVKLYRKHVIRTLDLTPLRGRDLVCWCQPDVACHADALLDAANRRQR